MSLYKAPKEHPPKIIPIGDETKGSVHIMIKYESTTGILIVRLNEVKYFLIEYLNCLSIEFFFKGTKSTST